MQQSAQLSHHCYLCEWNLKNKLQNPPKDKNRPWWIKSTDGRSAEKYKAILLRLKFVERQDTTALVGVTFKQHGIICLTCMVLQCTQQHGIKGIYLGIILLWVSLFNLGSMYHYLGDHHFESPEFGTFYIII